MKILHLIIPLILAATAINASAAPANDNFANSQTISAGLTTTNMTDASVEAGERSTTSGKTVWYTYTATSDSIITLDSTGTVFDDHFIDVFMGNSINNLIYIDGKSTGSTTPFSFSFKAKAGSIYRICAGDKSTNLWGGTNMKLTLFTTAFNHAGPLYSNQTPTDGFITNDRFDSRTTLAGNSLTVINYMSDSSVEAGEPDTSTGRTAWYSWTATSDSVITIDSTGTKFDDHFVSVYMGTSINNLIGVDRDSSGSTSPFSFSFKSKAGTTYQICAGDVTSNLWGGPLLQLTLTTAPFTYSGTLYGPVVPTAPTPKNDSFYTPQVLAGNLLTVIGSAASATTEPGEQLYERTLWHSWKTTANKLVSINVPEGSSGGFAVYTGSTLQTAVQVEPRSDSTSLSFKFNAVAGTTYKLVIGSTFSQHQFTLLATDPPVNHGPESRITYPKKGQVVPRSGFNFDGLFEDEDGDAIIAYEFLVNGKAVVKNKYPSNESLFSGKLKKGKLTLKMRSKDSLGKWGPYHSIKVKAK